VLIEKFHFYLVRLKTASLGELVYRARQFILVRRLKKKVAQGQQILSIPEVVPNQINKLHMPELNGHVSEQEVEEILQGRVFSLNTDLEGIREFERKTRHLFFNDIKLTGQDPDIRAVWEPARLQHLTVLLIYKSNHSDATTRQNIDAYVRKSILEWIDRNPFLRGSHYMSAMECGLRIPVFFYALKLLGNLTPSDVQHITAAMYFHVWWIQKRLSLYSSLGNHTIAESVGLIFGGAVFQHAPEGRRWLQRGVDLLEQELYHQILDDGGPAEQSLNYHRFVVDLYFSAIDFLEKNGLHDCKRLKARVETAEAFLSAFSTKEDSLHSWGDSDDGRAVAPGCFPHRLGSDKKQDRLRTFPFFGSTVIKDGNLGLIFNHGPLGMAPLYNHGHADALSLVVTKNGRDMLVDPGTFRYNIAGKYRVYFRGTRAHNTICIDGQEQAVQETNFIWSSPYKSRLIDCSEKDNEIFLTACHNGYTRLKDPVQHARSIEYKPGAGLIITDTFQGSGSHAYELNFHLHPDATILEKENDWWQINNQGNSIYIKLLEGKRFELIKGQEKPILGWYSPAYGIKQKSGVLSCTAHGYPEEVEFKTAIIV